MLVDHVRAYPDVNGERNFVLVAGGKETDFGMSESIRQITFRSRSVPASGANVTVFCPASSNAFKSPADSASVLTRKEETEIFPPAETIA